MEENNTVKTTSTFSKQFLGIGSTGIFRVNLPISVDMNLSSFLYFQNNRFNIFTLIKLRSHATKQKQHLLMVNEYVAVAVVDGRRIILCVWLSLGKKKTLEED